MKKLVAIILTFLFTSSMYGGQNDSSAHKIEVRGEAELGFLAVLDHKIQFSKTGTELDYRAQGGQDVLFPISRLSLELELDERNTFYLLYQPLRIESQVLLKNDLVVDRLTFPKNTSVNMLYNFPFYRLSYTRALAPDNDKFDIGIGASLQIRNATISFESADGSLFRTNRDLGPVPALKVKTRLNHTQRFFTELEADGMYAPVSYLNGSDNEVVGAILDASLRSGLQLNEEVSTFLNLRYLGGGAVGTSDDTFPGDGYVRNWLHFSTVTVGFVYEFK